MTCIRIYSTRFEPEKQRLRLAYSVGGPVWNQGEPMRVVSLQDIDGVLLAELMPEKAMEDAA